MSRASPSRRNATRSPQPSQVPAWVWLFTGAVLGAFIMFLMHLSDLKPGQSEDSGKNEVSAAKPAPSAQKPRFDFYELLKENEVPITPPQTKSPVGKPGETADAQEFLLQVASFKNSGDAERLRAELILLNLEAYTEDAKVRNGETWYRVMVGPFSSTSKMSKARSVLLSHRHEALVLKRKPQT